MRKVNGYVFVSSFNSDEIFGRPINYVGNHENLKTNGLMPYLTVDDAINSARIFVKNHGDSRKTRIARLEMDIAENTGEIDLFKEKASLIVIMRNQYGDTILGPVVEGKPNIGHLPGADVCDNGFQTFFNSDISSAFDCAYYLGLEVNRQAQNPATIATFKLSWIN